MINLLGRHFIKTGIFGKKLGRDLNDAYDKRLIGDYGIGFVVTEEEGKDLLETAWEFFKELEKFLKNWLKEEGAK